ncbi:MAG TPA: AbrB/MazE/SpoVT family DNA-binding domain-containing protein [Candidatus Dormibacteraeota bacterium]|nr:AbrB/MazE/SpoVT family DNA-binding domain-containing protein [Candidatus Dormibacteraeota bacterium]
MSGKEFKARITSKNQLTLPAGISALFHVGPGDDLRFEVQDDGTVTVAPPAVRERLAPLVGTWRAGEGLEAAEIDTWLRDVRGHDDYDDRA